jgi:hypothetical protein
MSILEFLANLDSKAYLIAGDGQFLGLLSSDKYNSHSISNPYGDYGSTYGLYSIRNPYGLYGGEYGVYSPYNRYCMQPPIIFYQERSVILVTRNRYVISNELPIIDPDLLLCVYAHLGSHDKSMKVASNNQFYLNQAFAAMTEIIK